MALTYTGSNGLFTRLGKIFKAIDAVRTHQNNLDTLVQAIQAEYTDADSYMIAQVVANLRARIDQSGGILFDLQAAAISTLTETCYADSLVSTRGVLADKSLAQSLLYLNREMASDTATINRSTISKASVGTGASNVGNGTLVFSEYPPNAMRAGGTQYQHPRSERLEVRCVQDAQDGAIRKGEEVWEVRGWPSVPNLDYKWPKGSGIRRNITGIHAGIDAGPRYSNILRNSDFEDFTTANVPDYWTGIVGTAGTHYAQGTLPYRGSSSLAMIGDGTTSARVAQQLNSTTGTPAALVADRLYVLAFAARTRFSPSSGTVRVAVTDSAYSPLANASVNAIHSIGTTYTLFSTTFRAPLSLSTPLYLTVEQTTPISAGGQIIIDEVMLAEMPQIEAGGIGVAVIAGSTNWAVDDQLRILVTNSYDGKIAQAFDRVFQMYEKGIVLPNSTTPSIADSLMT